jgi:hypothetical protein
MTLLCYLCPAILAETSTMVSWLTTTFFANRKLPHILRLDMPCGPAVVALSGRSVHCGTAGEREAVRIRSKGVIRTFPPATSAVLPQRGIPGIGTGGGSMVERSVARSKDIMRALCDNQWVSFRLSGAAQDEASDKRTCIHLAGARPWLGQGMA